MIRPLSRVMDSIGFSLFGRHLESDRHERDRARYRALNVAHPFETFLIRQYLLAWIVALTVGSMISFVAFDLLKPFLDGQITRYAIVLPVAWQRLTLSVLLGTVGGLMAKFLFGRLVAAVLQYLVRRRRVRIERTLPGTVRFLHVVATATADPRQLVEAVAARERIHGATARTFAAIRKRAVLSNRLEAAIRAEARDTPAQRSLAPFLQAFVEQSRRGETALRTFLADESRLLAVEDEHRSHREGRQLRRIVGFTIVLLVGPLVITVGLVWAGLVVPGLEAPIGGLIGPLQTGILSVLGGGTVLFVGGGAALFALFFRPHGRRWAVPAPAQSVGQTLRESPHNPTNALLVAGPLGLIVLVGGFVVDVSVHVALLAGYLAVAVPTGLVDLRRARRQARMDAALPAFVHELADRLDSGRPFREAVADIANYSTSGPLEDPINKLAADLRLLEGPAGGRKRALERFVGRIGTPFAGRTIGLAIGAIEAGADAQSAVTQLRTETGRLDHAETARRRGLPAVFLAGWAVATLVVAIVVVVNGMVLETATPTGPVAGVAIEAVETETASRPGLYFLTQATMLASGWFAGLTGRGIYEALFHSGVLLGITFLGFRLAGLL